MTPGSPTVGVLEKAVAQGQGPEPAPQGHAHPQAQMPLPRVWFPPAGMG